MAPKKKPVKVADGKDEPIISDSKPLTTKLKNINLMKLRTRRDKLNLL
jgi:hypothetical protein